MSRKILYVSSEFPPYPGGIGRYAFQIAKGALKYGFTDSVAVICPSFGLQNAELNECKLFRMCRYSGGVFKKIDIFRLIIEIVREIKNNKYDVVHAVDWPAVLAIDLINFFGGNINYIATFYGSEVGIYKRIVGIKYFSEVLFAKCTRLIAISRFTASIAEKELPFVKDRLKVVYLGATQLSHQFKGAKSLSYELKEGCHNILTVARIEPRKGHLDAVKAISRLSRDERKSVKYLMIGKVVDQSYFRDVVALAEVNNVNIEYLGVVDDKELAKWYAQSRVFLMPGSHDKSKVEGFGFVYLEAAQMGLPSVAYNISALPEVVVDNKSGFLVDYKDIDGLAACIHVLISERERWKEMSEYSRVWANNFSWEECVQNTYLNS